MEGPDQWCVTGESPDQRSREKGAMRIVKMDDIGPKVAHFFQNAAGRKREGLIEESGRLGKLIDRFLCIGLSDRG
jgi:hypothetical protein